MTSDKVKIIDGGGRETCPTSRYIKPLDKRKVEIKSSYDTEGILKGKFESKIHTDFHHGLNKATAFHDIPDEKWEKIFGKKH